MGTTLLAMWPLIIIFRASLQRLKHFHIRGKFIVFQLVMICGSLQDAILTQVANFNFLQCTQYLPVKSWALGKSWLSTSQYDGTLIHGVSLFS